MICVFDLGNSELKIGVYDNDTLIKTFRLKSDRNKTSDEYASSITSLFKEANINIDEVSGTILASVVHELTNEVKEAIKSIMIEPLIIGPGVKTGLIIKCDNPIEVGSDLVACSVGGINKYDAPLILVDAGTATKILIINEKKEFCGCIICPGLQISSTALTKSASALPELSLSLPKKIIGTNTVDCMKSGVVYGHGCMIEGLIQRVEEELGYKAHIILTGGLSSVISNTLNIEHTLDKNVLLDGLYSIYRRNTAYESK